MSLNNAYFQLMTKWAGRIGSPFQQFRPDDPLNPLGPTALVGTVNAIFDASHNLAFTSPSVYANAIFTTIVDPTLVKPGDYLTSGLGTWFIASTEPLKPILAVQCNRTGRFTRPSPAPAVNPALGFSPDGSRLTSYGGFYGGDEAEQEMSLMAGWPISELQGTKGERGQDPLPGDTRMPWMVVLVPAYPGIILNEADRLTDDLGRRFTVSSCELTDLGWRLSVAETEV